MGTSDIHFYAAGPLLTSNYISSSTIFVSNLSYSTTSESLQSTVSDIAPVRSAFVVTGKEDKKSKGVGYVSFAIKEDAEAFFEKYSNAGETLLIDGRKVRVQWADRKV